MLVRFVAAEFYQTVGKSLIPQFFIENWLSTLVSVPREAKCFIILSYKTKSLTTAHRSPKIVKKLVRLRETTQTEFWDANRTNGIPALRVT